MVGQCDDGGTAAGEVGGRLAGSACPHSEAMAGKTAKDNLHEFRLFFFFPLSWHSGSCIGKQLLGEAQLC